MRKDLPANNSLGEIDAGDVTTQETGGKSVTYALRSVLDVSIMDLMTDIFWS